jgi:4-amino-4-deoxy-L-arabinose transferase-like glycosyltransferase
MYRAYHLSMTHDEAGTTDHLLQSFYQILNSREAFHSANNHILNSWLMKWSASVFGVYEWSLRLPNVLAFALYYLAGIGVIRQLSLPQKWRFMGLAFFILHPFALDFFSLCRGYGLAMAFQMLSLFFTLKYIRDRKILNLHASVLACGLAVLSNMTWVYFLLAQMAWIIFDQGLTFLKKQKLAGWRAIPSWLIFACILGLVYRPYQWIQANGELKWGANGWFDLQHTFAKDYLYNDTFLTAVIFQILCLIIFVLFFQQCYGYFRKKENSIQAEQSFLILILLLGLTTLAILNRNLNNTTYASGRRALMYFPLVALMFILFLSNFSLKRIRSWIGVLLFSVLIFSWAGFRLNAVREWSYDSATKSVFEHIRNNTERESKIAVDWQFLPVMKFYARYRDSTVQVSLFEKNSSCEEVNWFYLYDGNIPPSPDWQLIREYEWGQKLFQRK